MNANDRATADAQMGKNNVLFENSTIGSLSTDGTLVYAVEDLAVAPINNNNQFKLLKAPKDVLYQSLVLLSTFSSSRIPFPLS